MATALPDSIRRLLEQQGAGFYDTPQQSSNAGASMSSLQQAIARRFGQSKDFDAEYESGIRGLMSQVPDLEAQFQNTRTRLDEDFALGAEQLDRDKKTADVSHLNRMANNGMGYSGANLVGQGRIGEAFQRGVQGLATGRSRALSDMTGAQNAAYRQLESRAGELQGQAANRASARDQAQAWQNEQIRMQQEQAKAQQEYAERSLQMQQNIQAQNEAATRRMQEQLRSMSQPQLAPTGAYRMPTPPQPEPTYKMRFGRAY